MCSFRWILAVFHRAFSHFHCNAMRKAIKNAQKFAHNSAKRAHPWDDTSDTLIIENNGVFPKWISLNSANSVNHDKIQKWYGYQSHYHLLTDTLPILEIKSAFSLLPLGMYLVPLTTWNRYQSTDNSGKFFFTTTSRNVTIVRCRMSLVTILVLVFFVIHWIRWIQRTSFRKNSIRVTWKWVAASI